MTLAAIVAMTADRVIGADGQIPWYLPADLQYFKRTTMGHPVIMGRKCFESIGRPLPKRTNIVLTRNAFYAASGVQVVHDADEALAAAQATGAEQAFVIGGADIYRLFWPQTTRLYMTAVHAKIPGDVYFPEVGLEGWRMLSHEVHRPDEKNRYPYSFHVYERSL